MQLRERVKKLRNDHNHIYHLTRSEGVPSVDWGKIIDEKTVSNQDYLLQSFSLSLFTSLVLEIKSFTNRKPTINLEGCVVFIQANLNNKGFGQDLPTVENEVEEHNIFHSEVEALAPYIGQGDKVI